MAEATSTHGAAQETHAHPAQVKDTSKATVAYILTWITGLIMLLIADKSDKFTRFHAIQAIGYGIVVVAVYILLSVVQAATVMVVGLWAILGVVNMVLWVAVVAGIVVLAVKAHKGEMFKLPFIGDMAEKKA